jgi:hypothetical protein
MMFPASAKRPGFQYRPFVYKTRICGIRPMKPGAFESVASIDPAFLCTTCSHRQNGFERLSRNYGELPIRLEEEHHPVKTEMQAPAVAFDRTPRARIHRRCRSNTDFSLFKAISGVVTLIQAE